MKGSLWIFLLLVLTLAFPLGGQTETAAKPALGGLDPVSVVQGSPQAGEERFSSVHGRFRYVFASAANKEAFDRDPQRWGFQLDGNCAMMPGTFADGQTFAVHNGRLYAFGSGHCKTSFLADPARYIAAAANQKSVAILIFDGVQIIDYTGPYEVFGQAGFRVFTVAPSAQPVTTNMGMKVTPTYALTQAPPVDVLVIPGGGVDAMVENAAVADWIRERAGTAQHVLTVCNGAFILARTGLLDGLTATTFYDLIPDLREAAPKTRIVSDQRYVDNGKIITTAGLSSGIDGSLHVVERMLSRARAQQAALNMEYDWRPESGYARASLADAELRRLFGRSLRLEVPDGQASVVSTEGTRDRWEARWEIKTATPLSALQTALARHLTVAGRWTPREAAVAGTAREWRFTDAEKRDWKALVDLQPAAGKTGEYQMAIRLERTGG